MTEPVKESATILDATAGNRMMWRTKEDSRILWIDIEPDLTITPDILLDCTDTKFEEKRFNLIVFDPPHIVGGRKYGSVFSTPNMTEQGKKWRPGRSVPAYYGSDKYQTRNELLSFITKAEKEFYRILSDNGVLFIKWNEVTIPLEEILGIFSKWKIMIKIPVKKIKNEDTFTYWLLLMKDIANPLISESINIIRSETIKPLENW